MKLYNSLTRTKDDFKPHTPGKVEMYTTSLTSATCAAISWRTCWKSTSAMPAMTSTGS